MGVILRYRKLKDGNRSYYLDINDNGNRYREFLNIKISERLKKGQNDPKTIQKLAEAIRNQRERELLIDGYEVEDIAKSNTLFNDYYERYVETYNKKDYKKIKAAFNHFQEHFGNIKAKQLTYDNCLSFKEYLESKYSKDTCRSYFGSFKKVLKKAVRDKLIKKNPCEDLVIKDTSKKTLTKDVLTIEELQKLEDTPCQNGDVKNSFLLMCNTGLGLAECRKLKWEHIKNDKICSFHRSKNDNELIIDLNTNAKYYLGKRSKKDDLVYTNLPSGNGYNKTLKAWVKRAKIDKKITSYCGRHTAACILLIHGANPKTVANILGHTSFSHTDRYLKHTNVTNKEAVNNIPSIKPKHLNIAK